MKEKILIPNSDSINKKQFSENIEVGCKVTVNKNLKSGRVVGKIEQNNKILYYVRLIDFSTKKIIGDFVYTKKTINSFGIN